MKPPAFTIYCHTHTASQMRYVGLTKFTMRTRWTGHVGAARRGLQHPFADAIREHGPEAFEHDVLETCATREQAEAAEIFWIKLFGSNHPDFGYNVSPGGSMRGFFPPKAAQRLAERRARSARAG